MELSRRQFTSGALGLAVGSQLARPLHAQAHPELAPAINAIRAYGEAHRNYFNLPGLTLGLTLPDGFSAVLNFGYAETLSRAPISPDTLFQIGSITKVMTAAVVHQLAGEGRVALTDRISALMPTLPLPASNAVTVQQLLDHVSGLAADAPLSSEGGLWLGFAPGEHWSYSNTGYEILGKLIEHVSGKPLARVLEERIFAPLGMSRTRGAILAVDRSAYAQGYEAADEIIPYARGIPLAPANWVDVTFAAGCIASTAEDMTRLLRSLASAVRGRASLGLTAEQAAAFTAHVVHLPTDTPGMTYGNGIMHVGNAGRSYIHHTGGMVSFSSSYHVDVASGVGAFASTNLSGLADYRPRLLTRFAVDALTSASAGRPLPSPPRLDVPLPNPGGYVGRYSGPAGAFEIKAGAPLTIVADGRSAFLDYVGGHVFRTPHPSFRRFSLMFDQHGGAITGASWGPSSYVRAGSRGTIPPSDPQLAALAGRYVDDNPWFGATQIVERGGKLWNGTNTPLTRIGENLWRVGEESWSPERASFADFIDGKPQTYIFSGEKFTRREA